MTLEPLEGHHAAALYTLIDDPEIHRYEPGDPYPNEASLRARYERTARGPSDTSQRWWNWAVIVRSPVAPAAIGTVELTIVDDGARALLGYWIGRAYWGAGYACEASTAALAYVRSATQVASVDAFVDTRNARSIALAERLGFTRIALLPDNDTIAGELADDYHYRLDTKDAHGTHEDRGPRPRVHPAR